LFTDARQSWLDSYGESEAHVAVLLYGLLLNFVTKSVISNEQ